MMMIEKEKQGGRMNKLIKLSKILKTQTNPYFPTDFMFNSEFDLDQDGEFPILGKRYIRSKKEAQRIELPKYVKLNWAYYCRVCREWEVSIGFWSRDFYPRDVMLLKKSLFNFYPSLSWMKKAPAGRRNK